MFDNFVNFNLKNCQQKREKLIQVPKEDKVKNDC